jgi:hypothetical protein
MIKGDKRSVLVARLSSSKNAIAKIKSKCRVIWSIVKQVWYVPFIWSLAWFSYWIFQESLVMGQSITQSNIYNQIGLAISIVAVFVAGYTSGKSRDKNQSDQSKRIKDQSKLYPQIETNQIRKPNETSATSFQALGSTRNSQKKANLSYQVKQQEIPSECLLCPNLTSCDQREKPTSDPAIPCPYAKDNHGNHRS